MSPQAVVILVLKVSIILTVFGFGLRSGPDDFLYLLRKPRLLVLSLIAMFVIMPLFAVLLTRTFSFTPAVAIALVVLSISPIPPLLPRKVAKSGGLAPYGLGLMVTAASVSIVVIPLATFLLGKYFDRPFGMAPVAVAKIIVPSVLAPLLVGALVHRFFPNLAKRIGRPLSIAAAVLLLLGVLCILIFAMPVVWSLIGNGTVWSLAAFIIVGLLVGHLLGGPNLEERVPLALSTACRHPALAIAIAAANIPKERQVLAAVLLYVLLNAILTLPYVQWQRKKANALATSL